MTTQRHLPQNIQVINLRHNYDEDLLCHFHEYTMKKFFPIEDELDPVDVWINNMKPENQSLPSHQLLPEMHICIAFDTTKKDAKNGKLDMICAAIVFEYYRMSGCALLSYLMVEEDYRSLGLGRYMVNHAYSSLETLHLSYDGYAQRILDANMRSLERVYCEQVNKLCEMRATTERYPSKFFAFFAETNAWEVSDGVLPSEKRHEILRRMGFRLLDFDYLQFPLSESQEPCEDLILLAFNSENAPRHNDETKYIPTQLMRVFFLEFGYSVFENFDFVNEDYFKFVMNDLNGRGEYLYLWDNCPLWKRKTHFRKQ